MQQEQITFRDQTSNTLYYCTAKKGQTITIICLPALGVRASYYFDLIEKISAAGFHSITIDWRGNGASSERPSRKNDWGYSTLLADIEELIQRSKELFPNTKIVTLGHSLGGQLSCLLTAKSPELIDELVLIACCSVYYKGWEGFGQFKILAASTIFYPLSLLFGYFPGHRLSFGGKEAVTLMRDWSRNGRNGHYKLTNSMFDFDAQLAKVEKRITAISIDQDTFAPPSAMANLYRKFSKNSSIKHLHLTKKETGVAKLNHFSWVKSGEIIADILKERFLDK